MAFINNENDKLPDDLRPLLEAAYEREQKYLADMVCFGSVTRKSADKFDDAFYALVHANFAHQQEAQRQQGRITELSKYVTWVPMGVFYPQDRVNYIEVVIWGEGEQYWLSLHEKPIDGWPAVWPAFVERHATGHWRPIMLP